MKEVTFPAGWLAQDVARAAQRQTEWRDAVPAAQTRDGEAMREIPQTLDEITAAVKNECLLCLPSAATEHLAKEVLRWREAWLREAEPRLRPVTETPNDGDVCAFRWKDGAWTAGTYRPFKTEPHPMITGWYLIKRVAVPLTHKEALELLVSDIRALGSPPEQLLVALAKAEEALAGEKP